MLPPTVGRQPSAALSHLKATHIKGHRVAKKTRRKLVRRDIQKQTKRIADAFKGQDTFGETFQIDEADGLVHYARSQCSWASSLGIAGNLLHAAKLPPLLFRSREFTSLRGVQCRWFRAN
jgi:hypothetical protein